MTKKSASCDKIVIFWLISYVNKAHHSPLSLRSINQRIITRKTEWCNPFFAHQRAQLTMEWAHCERKHEVKMTETHELNRPVICLRCAWVMHPEKDRERLPITDSVGQHRSHYQLRVVGALRLSTGVVSDSFFESDTTASEAVGSVVYNKIQLKRTAQTSQLYRRERR